MKESDLQREIIDYLFYKPGIYWRNNSVGIYDPTRKIYRKARGKGHINGVADILGCLSGQLIAIGVKTPKGRVSQAQKEFIDNINISGGKAFVARSIEDVEKELFGEELEN